MTTSVVLSSQPGKANRGLHPFDAHLLHSPVEGLDASAFVEHFNGKMSQVVCPLSLLSVLDQFRGGSAVMLCQSGGQACHCGWRDRDWKVRVLVAPGLTVLLQVNMDSQH